MTAVRRARHFVEYAAFRLIGAAARALPLEVASRWSGAGWRSIAPRLRRHKRAIENLTRAFPDKTPAEIEQIALGMWENLGRVFAEFFHLDQIVGSDRIQPAAPAHFAALAARRGGVVACSLHMANWELASPASAALGWRPAGVYQKISNPLVDRYVSGVRAPLYPGGLIEKSPGAARALLRYAREGGCAAVLADQRDGRGALAEFFGRPAPSTLFPATIARVVNVPLCVLGLKRVRGARFVVHVEEVAVPRTADRDADIEAATRALQSVLERLIREAPEQWMWAHRRWD